MTTAQIQKGKVFERIVQSYLPQAPDSARILSLNPSAITSLLEEYARAFQYPDIIESENPPLAYAQSTMNRVLHPDDINTFLLATAPFENKQGYYNLTRLCVEELLRKSYGAGFNNFVLQGITPQNVVNLFGMYGTPDRLFTLTLSGPVTTGFAMGASDLDIIFTGNVACAVGRGARHCRFTFLGKSSHVTLPVGTSVALDSCFQTPHKELYEHMYIPPKFSHHHNCYVLINERGEPLRWHGAQLWK